MASPSDGTESTLTPRALAIKITAHITLARNTDGEGRTRKIKPIRTRLVRINRERTRLKTHWESQSRNAAIIAKFAPLTAVKCESPTLRISITKLSSSSEVSPITNPGISAPPAPPTEIALLRNESLIFADNRCR